MELRVSGTLLKMLLGVFERSRVLGLVACGLPFRVESLAFRVIGDGLGVRVGVCDLGSRI